jgi:hypothetical protein
VLVLKQKYLTDYQITSLIFEANQNNISILSFSNNFKFFWTVPTSLNAILGKESVIFTTFNE